MATSPHRLVASDTRCSPKAKLHFFEPDLDDAQRVFVLCLYFQRDIHVVCERREAWYPNGHMEALLLWLKPTQCPFDDTRYSGPASVRLELDLVTITLHRQRLAQL